MDQLSRGHVGLDGVEEANELLVSMALHALADDTPFEHVQRGEQRGRAVPLVVMRHRARASRLHRQPGLGAVERLDLALLVNRQDNGVRRRIDIKADDVPQLGNELRVTRQLELPDPVGLKPVRPPDALYRADADADRLGHRRRRPMCRLVARRTQRQRDDAVSDFPAERRNARGSRLVPQQPLDTLVHEALLPTPNRCLALAGAAHDLDRAETIPAQKDDPCPPHVFLPAVPVRNDRFETSTVGGTHIDDDSWPHAPDSHTTCPARIPRGIQTSNFIH